MNNQLTLPGLPQPTPKPLKTALATAPKVPQLSKWGEKRKQLSPLPVKVSINPDCFTLYTDFSDIQKKRDHKNEVTRILNTGRMSRGARRKMSNAIQYAWLIAREKHVEDLNNPKNPKGFFKFKIAFITLTLASKQKHDDKWIKNNMLKHFIDACRRKYPLISYVWKAETQSNGNIHFHIATDHFIPKKYVNKLWYHIQWSNGYMQPFYEKYPDGNAPSAEIKSAKSKKGLGRYLRKYMIKEQFTEQKLTDYKNELDKMYFDAFFASNWYIANAIIIKIRKVEKKIAEARKRLVEGKLWGCSDNLLVKSYINYAEGLDENIITGGDNLCIFSDDFVTVFRIDDFVGFLNTLGNFARDDIRKHFDKIFHRDKSTGQAKIIPDIKYSTNNKFDYHYAA